MLPGNPIRIGKGGIMQKVIDKVLYIIGVGYLTFIALIDVLMFDLAD